MMARPKHPVSRNVVTIDADTDNWTTIVADYRKQKVYPYLDQKGWRVTGLIGAKATTSAVAQAMSQPGAKYITGSGHGDPNTFYGFNQTPILKIKGYSPAQIRGKIIHLLSCYTARELGPDMVVKGGLAFFGYNGDFLFDPDDAERYLSCASEVDFALADGSDASTAYTRVVTAYLTAIATVDDGPKNNNTLAMLQLDLKHFCGPGSPGSPGKFGDGTVHLPRHRRKQPVSPKKPLLT